MTFRLFLPALSVLSALTLTGCSALDAKVESWTEGKTKHDLKGLLFAVRPAGNLKGILSHYRWVKRDEAKGGIPVSACTRNSLGAVLAVRFSARYTFYR